MIGFILQLIFLALVLTAVATWIVYQKASQPGWASIVPVYGLMVLVQIVKFPSKWAFFLLIPYANVYFSFRVYQALAVSFGKPKGFAWGLLFAPFVFFPMLAFSKDVKYIEPAEVVE